MVLLLYFRPFDNSEFALNLRGLFFIFIIVLRILKRFPKELDLAYDFQWFNFFFSSQKEFLFSTDSSIICSLNNLKHPIYRLTRTSGVERQRARKSQNSLALKLWWPGRESNPYAFLLAADFKSATSTNSVTRPTNSVNEKSSNELPSENWSGKRVSNSRPQPWQGCALPTELFPHIFMEARSGVEPL